MPQFSLVPPAPFYCDNRNHLLTSFLNSLITQTIFDLAQHQEIIEPLRKEIVTVLSESGWKKTSLYKLKLMDSVVKETQRLKPVLSGTYYLLIFYTRSLIHVLLEPLCTMPHFYYDYIH